MLKLQLRNQPDSSIKLSVSTVTLGRDESNDVVINCPSASDFHAEINTDSQFPEIVDLLSANGTFVNERRVSGRQHLQAWDIIRLGTVELEVTDPSTHRPEDWALRSESDSLASRYHRLGASTVVGRNPDCELTIDDNLLSRRHARLILEDDALKVIDLGSANGTFINGEKIDEGTAQPGDELRFDRHSFTVVGPSIAQQSSQPVSSEQTILRDDYDDRTVFAADDSSPNNTQGTLEQAAVEAEAEVTASTSDDETLFFHTPPQPATLVAVDEPNSDSRVIALEQESISVGRVDGNDMVLADRSISKQHAEFTFTNGDWWIHDLGSSNGTQVNNQAITEVRLQDGDRIQFGRMQFSFHCSAQAGAVDDAATMLFEPDTHPPAPAPGKRGSGWLKITWWILALVAALLAAFFLTGYDLESLVRLIGPGD